MLLLPQALAGVASVALLYYLVRRAFGPAAGLLAALALAVTPISVVTDRNNTMDALLVLAALLGAWAVTRAAESGRLRLLLLCAALVGLGFNIKMLQAYLVVPAFGLVYLLGAPADRGTRVWHLGLAAAALLVVSLAWTTAVDLTPAAQRPYVGSSGVNSELSLILGYNGLGRLTESLIPSGVFRFLNIPIDLDVAPAFAPGIGDPGSLRLLNEGLAGQMSWLLVPAVVGLAVAAARICPRLPLDRRGQALVLWGGWLAVAGGYFSVARFFHPYYLVMLAPPVAALAGIGLTALWAEYLRSRWGSGLLPAALVIAALVRRHILAPYPDLSHRLTPLVTGACLLAAVALVAARLAGQSHRRIVVGAAAADTLSLLAAPTVWAAVSVKDGAGGAWLPAAGPSRPPAFARGGGCATPGRIGRAPRPLQLPGGRNGFALGGGQGALTFAGAGWDVLDPALALGGYQGWDRIVTPAQLAWMVADGTVRFFLLPARGRAPGFFGGPAGVDGTNDDLTQWARASCAAVSGGRWQTVSTTVASGSQSGSSAATGGISGGGAGAGGRPAGGNPFGGRGIGAGPSGTQQLFDCAARAVGQPQS